MHATKKFCGLIIGSIEEQIAAFKKGESVSSPVWIWYEKLEKLSICRLLLTVHLKQYRSFGSKANAWKIFEELSSLKDERLN